MANYTKEEQLQLIKDKWSNLKNIDNQYEEVYIEAIDINIGALKYVKEQTEDICLEAVKSQVYILNNNALSTI